MLCLVYQNSNNIRNNFSDSLLLTVKCSNLFENKITKKKEEEEDCTCINNRFRCADDKMMQKKPKFRSQETMPRNHT